MSPAAFANMLDLPVALVTEIVNEQRSLSIEVAERIKRHFGGDVGFWLRVQQSYDDKVAVLNAGQPVPARPAASS